MLSFPLYMRGAEGHNLGNPGTNPPSCCSGEFMTLWWQNLAVCSSSNTTSLPLAAYIPFPMVPSIRGDVIKEKSPNISQLVTEGTLSMAPSSLVILPKTLEMLSVSLWTQQTLTGPQTTSGTGIASSLLRGEAEQRLQGCGCLRHPVNLQLFGVPAASPRTA